MNKQEAIKIAQSLFPSYPGTSDFFITSDGEAFFTANDAQHHGESLGDKDQPFIQVNIEDKMEDKKTAGKTIKKIVTQEDLDANPDLAKQGVKVGDEIEFEAAPKKEAAQKKEASKK